MDDLAVAVQNQGTLIGDGAAGTEFARQGFEARDIALLPVTQGQAVIDLHLEYLKAGARVLETHTFAANRSKFQQAGVGADVYAVNRKAAQSARYARDIFGDNAWILGAIGPLALPVASNVLRGIPSEEARDIYQEVVAGLLAGGVDGFIVETMSEMSTVAAAVSAIRAESSLPIVVNFAFSPEGTTLYGLTPEQAAEAAAGLPGGPPFLIGANCGTGPSLLLDAILRMAPIAERLKMGLAAFPNAGQPQWADGRVRYPASPQYVARLAQALKAAGSVLVGGCCGTGPDHIRALASAGPELMKPPSLHWLGRSLDESDSAEPKEWSVPSSRGVSEILAERGFVISVELDPPRGVNMRRLVEAAERMHRAGADLINVADSPMARVRLSASATCRIVQEKVPISTILHFTTRDRNLMGLQSDLLGAYSLGIKNVLCLTGDPPGLGDYAAATAVYDLDSIGLVKVTQALNQGVDAVGLKLGSPTAFETGVGLNPNAPSLAEERERFRRKLEAGANFVMTQPVYEVGQLLKFLEAFGPVAVPILVGVMPLVSLRQAQYLNNEVPGITVPAAILARMEHAGDGADGSQIGVELALEFLDQVKNIVQGVYLVPSFNRVIPLVPIIEHLRRRHRSSASIADQKTHRPSQVVSHNDPHMPLKDA